MYILNCSIWRHKPQISRPSNQEQLDHLIKSRNIFQLLSYKNANRTFTRKNAPRFEMHIVENPAFSRVLIKIYKMYPFNKAISIPTNRNYIDHCLSNNNSGLCEMNTFHWDPDMCSVDHHYTTYLTTCTCRFPKQSTIIIYNNTLAMSCPKNNSIWLFLHYFPLNFQSIINVYYYTNSGVKTEILLLGTKQ